VNRRHDTGAPQRRRTTEVPQHRTFWRFLLAATVVVPILAGGIWLGFGDFLGRPAHNGEVISMRISMAGYDPDVLVATPGATLRIDWWNTDNAMHLEGGVHTLIAPELGIREVLAAESRRMIEITAPMRPGEYDFYCDSCCGGAASPTMHGTLKVVTA